MDEEEKIQQKIYREQVYAQFSCLTLASSFMSRAIAAIHLGETDEVLKNLNEAMKEISEAFERLDQLAGRGE